MDLNADLHGGWTLENAKARLNQFFQKEKMQEDYKYIEMGPDHNRFGGFSPCVSRVQSIFGASGCSHLLAMLHRATVFFGRTNIPKY